MKKIVFWIFVLVLFCIILSSVYTKMTGNEIFTFSFASTSKKAPMQEWKSILVGKWAFKMESESFDKEHIKNFDGTIEYFANGEFKQFVTATYKNPKIFFNDYVWMRAGGGITGTWEMSDNTPYWIEKIGECNISINYSSGDKFEVCSQFANDEGVKYGDCEDNVSKSSVEKFTNNTIIIKKKHYAHNEDVKLTLKKEE